MSPRCRMELHMVFFVSMRLVFISIGMCFYRVKNKNLITCKNHNKNISVVNACYILV